MAEEKKSPAGMDPWYYWLFGLVFLILVLGSGYYGYQRSNNNIEPDTFSRTSNFLEDPWFSITKWATKSSVSLGDKIILLKDSPVRNNTAGLILGVQKKLSIGKVIEGPFEKFGTRWWRVEFEEAPSGFVDEYFLSSKNLLVKLLNFPSIFYSSFKPIGWLLSIILLLIVIILKLKLNKENKILKKKYEVIDEQAERKRLEKASKQRSDLGILPTEAYKNTRWEHVKELMKSKNQNDWRQAIIEADIILDEMLRRMSYDGLTIGDMLKQVEASDFATLDKAWEAHKFRNEIAHTGSEFQLSKSEADRIIELFESVFNEFYYV